MQRTRPLMRPHKLFSLRFLWFLYACNHLIRNFLEKDHKIRDNCILISNWYFAMSTHEKPCQLQKIVEEEAC